MRIRIQIAYVAIGVTYVVVMATLLGACQPFHHFWQINPDPGGNIPLLLLVPVQHRLLFILPTDQCHPATSKLTCSVVVVCNVLTDLYLLHIPILVCTSLYSGFPKM